jgi:transcriptional regulator with XRE-family HTH domain
MVMTMNASTLTSAAIRRRRRAKGLSQAQLAAKAGLSHPSVISNAERGLHLSEPVATKIAEALQ